MLRASLACLWHPGAPSSCQGTALGDHPPLPFQQDPCGSQIPTLTPRLQAFGILVTTPGAVPSGLSAVVAAYVMLVVLIIALFTAVIGRHNQLLPDSKEVGRVNKCGCPASKVRIDGDRGHARSKKELPDPRRSYTCCVESSCSAEKGSDITPAFFVCSTYR